MGTRATRDHQDQRAFKDNQDRRAHQVLPDQWDNRVKEAKGEGEEIPDLSGHQVLREFLVHQVLRVRKVIMEPLGKRETRDGPGCPVCRDRQDHQVLQAIRDVKDRQVHRDNRVYQDHEVYRARTVRQGQLGLQVCLGQEEQWVTTDLVDHQDLPARPDHRGHRVMHLCIQTIRRHRPKDLTRITMDISMTSHRMRMI